MSAPLVQPPDAHNQRLLAEVHPPDWRNPTPKSKYDLVVIGGGTAGLVCAAGAAGLGARVALVERALLGGDCLNTGCVPSKTLLRSARAVHDARQAAAVGVRATTEVDFAAVMARVRARRADLAHHDSVGRLTSLGVDVFLGPASFSGRHAVMVGGRVLVFRRAVVATGSRPAVPEAVGAAPHHTSETIFSITEQPRELVVLGAGPVGCELAQAFALLGTRVTLVESAPRILSGEDADASGILSRRLADAGVGIRTSHAFQQLDEGTTLLVATGRTPNVEGLNLEGAGVSYGPQGVEVNDRLQTTNPRVFAAGDVCSRFKFTHAADAAARIVIQNALFFGRRRASVLVIPWTTYTMPEIGRVGSIDGDAITIRLADVDRAVVEDDTDGFVRVHHDRGRVVGATIVAAHAGELIGQVASLMRRGGRLDEWSSDIFPYPTLSDALRKAGDAYRRTRLTPGVRAAFERYFRLVRGW